MYISVCEIGVSLVVTLITTHNVLSFHPHHRFVMKVFTERSFMVRMGVGAAGFSSTWNLIDPLIAGIGHRVKTPATPPGFLSDGTMFR